MSDDFVTADDGEDADGWHRVPVAVRLNDVDGMGHVNNAVYATYLEEARIDSLPAVAGVDHADLPAVLAHLEIDYRRPIREGADVVVAVRVADVGETSLALDYRVVADGEVVATAETVQVFVDPDGLEPESIPEGVRERLEAAAN